MQLLIIRFQHLIVCDQRLDDFDDLCVFFSDRLGDMLKTKDEWCNPEQSQKYKPRLEYPPAWSGRPVRAILMILNVANVCPPGHLASGGLLPVACLHGIVNRYF